MPASIVRPTAAGHQKLLLDQSAERLVGDPAQHVLGAAVIELLANIAAHKRRELPGRYDLVADCCDAIAASGEPGGWETNRDGGQTGDGHAGQRPRPESVTEKAAAAASDGRH